ncbi:MAG: hypothetical protein RSE43_03510 [Oscillospiraceae bacterium]
MTFLFLSAFGDTDALYGASLGMQKICCRAASHRADKLKSITEH